MLLDEFYKIIGGNYQNVLIYIPSDKLILKYISKFLEDNSFILLEESLKDKDYEKSFIASHTLKGICANLGFTKLLMASSILVEELRKTNNINTELVNNYFMKLKEEYNFLVNNIRLLLANY